MAFVPIAPRSTSLSAPCADKCLTAAISFRWPTTAPAIMRPSCSVDRARARAVFGERNAGVAYRDLQSHLTARGDALQSSRGDRRI
jgi:hypothetical protein